MQEEQVWWPPPPAHELLSGMNRKKVTPPKPDTPPTAVSCNSFLFLELYGLLKGSNLWNGWSTPTKPETNDEFSITLPKMQTPNFTVDMKALMSPATTIPQSYYYPLDARVPMISAPDPGQLPHPDKLLGKGEYRTTKD